MNDIDPIYIEIAKVLKKENSKAVPKMIAKIANLDQAKIIEVIEFLDKLDEDGLVTMTGNSNRMPSAICSCCNDCCGLFVRSSYTKPLLNKVAYARSRFVIEDDPEECIACGACTDNRCPVDAITMKAYDEFDDERSYTDNDECIGCGLCVLSCPTDARKMKLVRPIEHIPDRRSAFD